VPTTTWIGERVCPTCRGTEVSPYANKPGDCPTCAGRGHIEVPLAVAPPASQVPIPVLGSISPNTAVHGTGNVTIQCNGSGFTPSSQVYYDDEPVKTTYVSSTVVRGVVSMADETAGTKPVSVRSLSGRSANQTFTVT
jgi:hypothetical protein